MLLIHRSSPENQSKWSHSNPFSSKLSSSTVIPISKLKIRNLTKLKRYRVRYSTDQQKETVEELRLSGTSFDLVRKRWTKRIIWKWIRNSVSPNSETREVEEVAESRLLILLRFQDQNALSFHWRFVLCCVAFSFSRSPLLCTIWTTRPK